jgi:hypothetical protein
MVHASAGKERVLKFEYVGPSKTIRIAEGVDVLVLLIQGGVIKPDTFVKISGSPDWILASKLPQAMQTYSPELHRPARDRQLETSQVGAASNSAARPMPAEHKKANGLPPAVDKMSGEDTGKGDSLASQPHRVIPISGNSPSICAAKAGNYFWAFLAFVLGSAGLQAGSVILYATQLRELFHRHGWGMVPPSALAQLVDVDFYEQASVALLLIGSIFYFLTVAQPGRILRSAGVQDIKWSNGWTVGGFFIPIVFLYRPWVGLNESEQTIRSAAAKGEWPRSAIRRFGWRTWLYAITLMIAIAVQRIADTLFKKMSTEVPASLGQALRHLGSAEAVSYVALASTILICALHMMFWLPFIRRMKQAARI